MSPGRVATSRSKKYNNVNLGYKSYDWRPRGRDGESKKQAARTACDAAETLSRRLRPRCLTQLDPHPAGVPSCSYNYSPRRSPEFSPGSISHSIWSNHDSKSVCDYRQCNTSEKFISRISSPHSNHGGSVNSFGSNSSCSGVCSQPRSSRDAICLRHSCAAPQMEPAGIITCNYEYPDPHEMHSIVRLDSYVKYQGVYNCLGQLVKESFRPRLGDAIIVKMPRMHSEKDHGYVEFFTKKHEGCHFCPGDLLLRVGKFVENNVWRYNKRYKLYLLTDERRWLIIGLVDNFVNLLPVQTHGLHINHVDQHCRFFYPRRGDMVVHVHPPDRASQLEWFNPKTSIDKGDILVRMYLEEPKAYPNSTLTDVVGAAIEIYMYSGKGFGWIFMGRDDCWFKNGYDLLESSEGSTI